METTFYQIPIGARFEFRGRRYEKLALSMARDEERCGNIFQDEAEVFWHCKPSEQPAAPKPPRPHWTTHLCPAPGQRSEKLKPEIAGRNYGSGI
jgi:hypothetical protein